MSLLNLRHDSYDLPSNIGLMLEIMTALLITFAATLVTAIVEHIRFRLLTEYAPRYE
jgi:hypothetical protein